MTRDQIIQELFSGLISRLPEYTIEDTEFKRKMREKMEQLSDPRFASVDKAGTYELDGNKYQLDKLQHYDDSVFIKEDGTVEQRGRIAASASTYGKAKGIKLSVVKQKGGYRIIRRSE